MNEKRICAHCKKTFIATRRDKVTCSKQCSSSYSIRNKTRKKHAGIKDEGEYRTCPTCGEKKLRNRLNFYQEKSTKKFYNACIPCYRYAANARRNNWVQPKRDVVDDKILKEMGDFIKKICRQNCMATDFNIFELIHFYDIVKPTNNIPNTGGDPDTRFSKMFDVIFKFYTRAKNQLKS